MVRNPASTRRENRKPKLFLLVPLLLLLAATTGAGQTTSFTYQGRLTDGGPAANGSYDFVFRLFDAATGGTQLGPINAQPAVPVTNGVFTVQLSFGSLGAFPDNFSGGDRYLEIAVRQHSIDPNAPFTTLSPRQQITSSPYAIRSDSAASADTAANALQIGGVPANQFVVTSDPRLSDARPPAPGNSNYVQNTTVAQAASNFNISGNGTAGATLSANIVNSATEYDLAGSRVLIAGGASNTFLGLGVAPANSGFANSFFGNSAGAANTKGANNSFFGSNAGSANTGDPSNQTFGSANSFFGSNAGLHNSTGFSNSFLGNSAGNQNATGAGNTFIGSGAGFLNTDGSNNTYLGSDAGGSPSLVNATAIGAGASVTNSNTMVLGTGSVTVQVPGNLAVTGTLSGSGLNLTNLNAANITSGNLTVTGTLSSSGQNLTNLNASNITSGTLNNARLGIVPITNGGTGSSNQNFVDLTTDQTIAGNKTFTGAVDTSTQYNIGGNRVLSVGGDFNVIAGLRAGEVNAGIRNAFFGDHAGQENTSGAANAFFGQAAGEANTVGSNNVFIGFFAGNLSGGSFNTAIGSGAGGNLAVGSHNVYVANFGVTNESNTIRIGDNQTQTFIAGINGIPVTGAQVFVNANGQLGTLASSRRFKQNIRDMGAQSNDLLRLRPVTFQYRPEYSNEPSTLQYGLIAEEVAKVYPNLVAYGKDGKPYTVLYHLLPPMLLNEVQKQTRQVHVQEQQLKTQERQINLQAQQLKAQNQQLSALSARLARLETQQAHRHRRQPQHSKSPV